MSKLRTMGLAGLLGLPAILYLILAAWIELGLPFPIEQIRIPQITRFDGYDDNIIFFHESFRQITAPVALVAILAALSIGLTRAVSFLRPFILSSLVIIAYLAFMGWDGYVSNPDCRFGFGSSPIVEFGQVVGSSGGCYEPTGYLEDLGVHTDEHSSLQAFSMTAEAIAIIALLAISSLWAGFGLAGLLRHRFSSPAPAPRLSTLKNKGLVLGGASVLGLMVVFIAAAHAEATESPTTNLPTRVPDPVSSVDVEIAGRWPFFGFPFAVTAGVFDGVPYAFLGVGSSQAGVVIIDLSDPSNPAQVGEMLIPRQGPVERRGSDLALAGHLLYVADASGLHIVDVSDPASPQVLGSMDLPPEGTHAVLRISIDGNLALMAAGTSGAYIVDVSDVSNPRLVSTVATPGPGGGSADSTESVYLHGNLAFLADERAGLRIIDISDPTTPVEVGAFRTRQFTQDVFVQGRLAYVVDGGGGIQILDISEPASPSSAGYRDLPSRSFEQIIVKGNLAFMFSTWELWVFDISRHPVVGIYGTLIIEPHFIQDIFVEGDTAFVADAGGFRAVDISVRRQIKTVGSLSTPERVFAVDVQGAHAYVAAGRAGLRVVGITDMAAPVEVGHLETAGSVVDVAVQGELAFTVEGEEFSSLSSASQGLRVIDISDPASPREVGSLPTPGEARRILVRDNLAFIADGTQGLRIIDISDPTSPQEISSQDTTGSAEDLFIQGDHAYVANGEEGLRVIDISNPASPRNVGSMKSLGSTVGVYVLGELAFVKDSAGLRVVDVSNPSSPKPVGFLSLPGGGRRGISVQGDMVFVESSGRSTLQVIDVSDPAFPREVGSVDGLESVGDIILEGDLAYVAYQSGVAIIETSNGDVAVP